MKMLKYLRWIIGIIFVIIFIFWIKSCKKDKDSPEKDDEKPRAQWVVTDTKTISIDGNYSNVYYLSHGEGLSIKNATQPYCGQNENLHEVCGEIGEDITPKFSPNDPNLEFRFRTSNGKNGKITLTYWTFM